MQDALADPKGGALGIRPLGPISLIFMQFSTKILSNNRLSPQIHGLTPLSGKSWIRHWDAPILINEIEKYTRH